jgi:serine/threonine protein kinase/tetratricopeptide (TPR) repeat protein
MSEAPLPLGPFDLLEPVARGGMSQVWKAVHREQQVPVAVKIVTPPEAQRAEFERRFADEVRAVAALDHPGVVMVLDHGRLPETAGGHVSLSPGNPWLAMEWASGGTLASQRGPMPWPMLKTVLLALLDALAHAHAHGVVHRDLKPQNVLLSSRHDARPGIKLSDFGIAFAGAPAGAGGDLVMGTPSYMAPEQIRGDWRDYGPWTDLYALGCLTWWLCAGQAPFTGHKAQGVMIAHLSAELPPFQPRLPVPQGFERWLSRLLEKRWDRRFLAAADAAYALATLSAPELPETEAEAEIPELDPAFQDTMTGTDVSFGESWRLSLDSPVSVSPESVSPVSVSPERMLAPLPIPDSWRRPLPKPPPMQLVGAGLSLYGLRTVELAGREAERDLLWRELTQVASAGRARVVLIHGPAGTGKSRLVEWICRRAHELGAANWCKATFVPGKAPGQALQEMGVDYLRLRGLSREDVASRVRRFLLRHGSQDEAEAAVLTELLSPATDEDILRGARPVRLTRPHEYYVGTSNTMYRLSTARPLVAWLDDVQHGLHGLGLAIQILRSQDIRPFPCLLLLTMRNEALDEASDEARRLQKLMDIPGASELPLPPLPPAAHRELVRGLLGLDDTLAARVEERTGGNPLFATQLVGSWVQNGTLEVGERGFRLKPGARAELPDDLHAVWSAHVGRVLGEFPPSAQEYLELAAVLGHEVLRDEWRRACDDPQGLFGDRFPGDEGLRSQLVERLLVHRLVVGSRHRWAFVHGMLRESLLRTARQAGRWRQHHEACAATFADRAADPRYTERLGRHLLDAGQTERALLPLLRGVEHRLVTVGPQPAQALLDTVEGALRGAGVPESDARWGWRAVLMARIHQELGQPEQALEAARQALAGARRHGWAEVAFHAAETEAQLLLRLGRLPEAEQLLQHLEAEARRLSDPLKLGAALAGQAHVARRKRQLALSLDKLEQAIVWLQRADPAQVQARLPQAQLDRGRAAEGAGDPAGARRRYDEALAGFQKLGAGLGMAESHDRLGRLSFAEGDLTQARSCLSLALSQYEALGSERQLACRMRLARVVLRLSPDPAEAWAVAAQVEPLLSRLDHRGRLAAGYALQLVRHGLERDWPAWDEALAKVAADPQLAASVGTAWLCWLAADAARLGEQPLRAETALHAAEALFLAAGDRASAAELVSART